MPFAAIFGSIEGFSENINLSNVMQLNIQVKRSFHALVPGCVTQSKQCSFWLLFMLFRTNANFPEFASVENSSFLNVLSNEQHVPISCVWASSQIKWLPARRPLGTQTLSGSPRQYSMCPTAWEMEILEEQHKERGCNSNQFKAEVHLNLSEILLSLRKG